MTRHSSAALLCFAVLLAAGCSRFGAKEASFKTAKVGRADIASAIDATGTVEPEDVVDIGAQVTGQILSFGNGADGKVLDYGSHVEAGQLMAKIDDVPYTLARNQAEAQLGQAEANVKAAEARFASDTALIAQNVARLQQAEALLAQATRDWERAKRIGTTTGALTQAAFDAYRGAYESADAAVGAARATCDVSRATAAASQAGIAQAQSAVAQAKVAIALADRNLGYCTIASPIKGIIIDRRVDVGQTVVSNLNASSLFLLAKDLSKMQVWASVNEADIGNIRSGQPVRFTVDAFPGRTFKGQVDKVRLNASMTQNVVTYTVEINTDNADGSLLPYLTANVKFEVARHEGVLAVPNAALRWQPTAAQIAPGPAAPAAAESAGGAGDGERKGGGKKAGGKGKGGAVLWIVDGPEGERVRSIKVRTGISDGVLTEIVPEDGGALAEGQEVVIGQDRAEQRGAGAGDGATNNPFAPKPIGGRQHK